MAGYVSIEAIIPCYDVETLHEIVQRYLQTLVGCREWTRNLLYELNQRMERQHSRYISEEKHLISRLAPCQICLLRMCVENLKMADRKKEKEKKARQDH